MNTEYNTLPLLLYTLDSRLYIMCLAGCRKRLALCEWGGGGGGGGYIPYIKIVIGTIRTTAKNQVI